jgi:hypothetical protein
MVKKKGSNTRHSRRQRWNFQLATTLSAAERLVGPPLGSNHEFSYFLHRTALLLEKLGHVTEDQFFDWLEDLASNSPKLEGFSKEVPADIEKLSLEDVERRLNDSSLTKDQLLELVRYRFRGPIGTLTRLPRQALIERITTLVMNERGHHTVARLAANDESPGFRSDKFSDKEHIK